MLKNFSDSILHYPDKDFFDWCQIHFGINRGVFNTIDQLLFAQGYKDIIKRRNLLIHYLNYVIDVGFVTSKGNRIKFGKGGVKCSMDLFLHQLEKVV